MSCVVVRVNRLKGRLNDIHTMNHDDTDMVPRSASQLITFMDQETAECWTVSDLEIKKKKRNDKLRRFYDIYVPAYLNLQITILSGVFSLDKYSPTEFFRFFKRKLKRADYATYGYFWMRDIGDKEFKRHAHFLFAMSVISTQGMQVLQLHGCPSTSNVQYLKGKRMMDYLKKKEMFGKTKQHSYGLSRQLLLPPKL